MLIIFHHRGRVDDFRCEALQIDTTRKLSRILPGRNPLQLLEICFLRKVAETAGLLGS